jgi:hypothetical protein
MNYKDYERVIQGGLGWTLVSWPEGTTFAAPSNFKAGGSGHIFMLWQHLKSGACRFDPTDPALRAEILARTSGKQLRKAKGSTAKLKSTEEPDAEEPDVDTYPEPAAGKKRKQQEEDKGEVQEGGSGKKSVGGKKAKQAEGKEKEKEKRKEKRQKGKEDSGGKKPKWGTDSEQDKPSKKKKKSKPFAHSTSHKSAKLVATDNNKPKGSTASGNMVAGGSSGTGGSNGVAGGGTGGNVIAGGSTGPSTSSWEHMQEKRVKDLKAAAETKQRMEADIAADIVLGKLKLKVKRKRQPKSTKEIDEDNYNDEDSS